MSILLLILVALAINPRGVCGCGGCEPRKSPRRGGWSDWEPGSFSDASCQSGYKYMYRYCDNPSPDPNDVDELQCSGEDTMKQDCNECDEHNGGCADQCKNNDGSFSCRCSKGYKLKSDGKNCEKLECPQPDVPKNGKLLKCDDRKYQAGCMIECLAGYSLNGLSVRYCVPSGDSGVKWTEMPTCKVNPCDGLKKPENGRVEPKIVCEGPRKHGQSCTFHCNAGYTGSKRTPYSIKCNDGNWKSSTGFYCFDKTPPKFNNCPISLNVYADSGRTNATVYWKQVSAKDSGGLDTFTVDPGDAKSPRIFPAGTSIVTYKATDRSGNEKSCRLKVTVQVLKCPVLYAPPNGKLHNYLCGNVYGSVCRIECNTGFTLRGSNVRKCDKRNNNEMYWTGTPTRCQIVQCPSFPIPDNAIRSGYGCNGNGSLANYSTTCLTSCKTGFVGSNKRTCLETGQWSGSQLVCSAITCPRINITSEGLVIKPDSCTNGSLSYATECRFTCKEGYQLIGTGLKTCTQSAKMLPTVNPSCKDVAPPKFSSCPKNIFVTAAREKTSSKVEWVIPDVMDNSGIPPNVTLHGKNSGTIFNPGDHVIRYSATDKRGNLAECIFKVFVSVVRCLPKLAAPPGGKMECTKNDIYGSVCTFACRHGYTLEGSVRRVCEMNGTTSLGVWTGSDTRCALVRCPHLALSANTLQSGCGGGKIQNVFGDKCLLYCQRGFYQVSGSTERICQANGTWSGQPLRCREVKCSPLHPPAHGYVKPDACNSSPKFGVSCYFSCRKGFRLQGEPLTSCLSNGEWSTNSSTLCKDRESPSFGQTCPVDFRTTADKGKNYTTVSWPPVVATDNSGINPVVTSSGVTPKYYKGKHLVVYNASDQAGNFKICQFYIFVDVTRCQRLLPPFNGFFVSNCGDTYGSRCIMGCSEGYYLNGSATTTCLVKPGHLTGYWDTPFPTCKIRTCSKLKAPSSGYVSPYICTISPVSGTYCDFECKYGYKIVGNINKVHCGNDGKWDKGDKLTFNCKDVVPPLFLSCPLDIAVSLEKDSKAEANWTIPVASDNSNLAPIVTVSPKGIHPPHSFSETTRVDYTAVDSAGNIAKCSFKIEVEDNEGPEVVYCPPDMELVATRMTTIVKWKEPQFKDNSNEPLNIRCSHKSGSLFYWGTWNVQCSAHDSNINNDPALCKFTITVKPNDCPDKKPPKNGAMSCDDWALGRYCVPFCNDRWDFVQPLSVFVIWVCGAKGKWAPPAHWPDCSLPYQPSQVRRAGALHYYTGDCTTPEAQAQIKTQFIQILNTTAMEMICNDPVYRDKCKAENVKVTCGLVDIGVNRNRREAGGKIFIMRHRRAVPVAKITFEIVVDLDDIVTDNTKQSKVKVGDSGVQITKNISKQIARAVDDESISLTLNGKKILPDKKSLNFSQPKKVCSKGQTFRDGFCLNCTAGTFLNKKLGTCEDCAIGFYQEQDAQIECNKCPPGTSTAEVRTDNSSSCLAVCGAGTFSPTGLEPCIRCEKGRFQERKGQNFCTKCKEGQTTSSEGSNSSADCGIACPMGSFSATGLEPCTLCDRRSFQPNTGRRECLSCPGSTVTKVQGSKSRLDCLEINECDSSPCINNSTCKSLVADYLCSCPLGFAGKQCEINIDDCKDEPCLNNGTCHDLVNGFICTCASGFEGINCEKDVDECLSLPCLNNASCSNVPGDFTCLCEPGFTGVLCDVEIDECSSSPCLNGATCVDKIFGYECVCDRGFQGTDCEDKLEACASFPCQNGARCVDGTNNYQCVCSVGYKGQQCETNIDDCSGIPCLNNATCIDGINGYFCHCENGFTGKTCEIEIDECLLDVCENNGTCIKTDNDNYKCECKPGFDGLYCENNIDDCASNPCSNQATCQDEVNNFTCSCPPGYTGKDCNVDIDECESLPCLNNATCLDDLNSFTCHCVDGFEGALCETEIDECASSPCGNTGYCIDQVNDYRCKCFYGFTGISCEINIDECGTNPCLNDGTCVDSLGGFKCACKTGYAGNDCSVDTNDCWSFPCYNNGTCVDKVNHYVCECAEGFVGSRCETNAVDCFENLCLNGGICRDGINSYTCDCASGFWGQHCEIEINECDSYPCLYGGSCHDEVNGFRCTCLTGFTGSQCEENINDCELNPCANNGTCLDQVGYYTCDCPEGFTGTRCEKTIDYCADVECEHNGKCINSPKGYQCECLNGYFGEMCQLEIDECYIQPCFNDATCIDGVNSFTCLCPKGFTGEFCEYDIDDCANKPCKNSVACADYINGFTCICSEGYNGTLCENDIDECESSPCLNNGTCKNLAPGYKCDCLDIFAGKNCETEWDACQSRPCRNGGNCSIDYFKGTFLCTCPPGFTGLQCERNIDDCREASCFENSFCIDLVNGYKCECLPSYTGDQCDILLGSNFDLVFKGNSTNNMVLLTDNDRVPSMLRFTIAMFVRADSKFKSGTLFGYSVEQNIGETILLYFSSLQIHLKVKDKVISADSTIADDKWHFVAGVWNGETGVASLYFDGVEITKGNNILKGSLILGGGWISLGKRYLAAQKKADPSTSFSGTLHQVNVWSTAAQPDHMWLAAQSCTWPIPGSLKGWADFLFGIKGKVEKKFKSDCKALEMSAGNSFHFKRCGSRNANYYCICEPGFTGDHCKINIDECASNPCVRGTCVDGINQYDCVCNNGYWGKNCEKKMNIVRACPKLGTPFKGYKDCSKSAGRAVCTLKCPKGHSFDVNAETTFECGPDTKWRWNRKSKVKLPRCSSDVLPSEIKHKFSLNFTDISCQRNQNLQQLPVLVQRQVWTSLRSVPGCSFADECKTRVAKASKCRSENDALEILFLVSIKSSHSTLKVTIDDTSEAVLFQLQYIVSTGKFTIRVDGIYMTAKRSSLKHLSTQFKCPPGSVVNIKRAGCVACPVGTFYDKETLKCKACGHGSYQDREGQTSCLFYNEQGKRK